MADMPRRKPGIGLMIALGGPSGGRGAPPPYKSPRPMEDGGNGTPKADSRPEPRPADPDAGRPEQSAAVSPAAVLYHKGNVNCGTCEYMEQSGNCQVLKMPVEPEDWCNAHEDKAGDMDMGMMGDQSSDEGEHEYR